MQNIVFRSLLQSTVFALLIGQAVLVAGDRPIGKSFATRSAVVAKHGMAATSQPLATMVAIDILKKGGSAVDAAIAANATLGLMEPTGNGIGGDLFAIVWDAKTKTLSGLNASGRSPATLTLAEFKRRELKAIPPFGPLPVTVPGCVDGWFELHKRYGTLPMTEVLAPAIGYAEDGFPVSEVIAYYWRRSRKVFEKHPGFLDTYFPDGNGPQHGDVFRNPMLAKTLTKIAEGGRDEFYKGQMAHTIADFMAKHDGFLTYEDLATHQSEWVQPVSTNYRGYNVWELPPNGQGIAALQMLNVLEGYDLKTSGFGSPNHLHWFVEAKKLAFEDRARLYADMDFYDAPVATLISKDYATKRRGLIDDSQAAKEYAVGVSKAIRESNTTPSETSFWGRLNLAKTEWRPGIRPTLSWMKSGRLSDKCPACDCELTTTKKAGPGVKPGSGLLTVVGPYDS